ncbi:MAG: hypothetical protein ACI8WT_003543 [Clostridium sp.]|jgi:hypothetical protein
MLGGIIMNLVFAYGSLVNRKEIEKTLKKDDAQKDYGHQLNLKN